MGKHDRGAFGALMDEAKELGCRIVSFVVDLEADDDEDDRWLATDGKQAGTGRTGEEAFRAFVEVKRRG